MHISGKEVALGITATIIIYCSIGTSAAGTSSSSTHFHDEPTESRDESEADPQESSNSSSDEEEEDSHAAKDTNSSEECSTGPTSEGMHPAVRSGDFGQVVQLQAQRDLTDSEKFFLLKHHSVPSQGFQFPTHIFQEWRRHFQSSWLHKYGGLVYSESQDGGYCKYCILFARCEPLVQELGVLVNRPLTNFKKATEKLNEHFCSKGRRSYQAPVERAMTFIAVMEK